MVKVLDFGVAKITEPSLEMGVQLTQAGTFVGTPRYASPEQMRREELTAASDVYGVGMIMWECLTGKPPVPSTDFPTCVAFHLGPDPWVLPPNVDCPRALQKIVEKALKKHHADRYQTCESMLEELSQFRRGHASDVPERSLARERLASGRDSCVDWVRFQNAFGHGPT